MELSCPVQTYAWGKLGAASAVANLKASSDSAFKVDSSTPYAELWMGTHVNGPARIAGSAGGQSLLEYIQTDPKNILGEKIEKEFGGRDLPFLFKVLSVGKALSIQVKKITCAITMLTLAPLQVHPDKANAERLHASRPDVYKDANHKPEM